MTPTERPQPLEAQKGEIEFRKRLIQQQVHGEQRFQDELDAGTIESILRDRMEITRLRMVALRDRGIVQSPYLEIGAERGQRSLVMENDLDATGAAADLSADTLESCAHYAKVFGKARLPLRVACDAHRLPFTSGSIPFAFCYQTLHHFPDPTPIIREIHRVVAPGGHFYFDEEPFKRELYLPLYKRKKTYSQERAPVWRALLDRFFAEEVLNEEEYGIVENHQIPLVDWRRMLSCFEGPRDVTVACIKRSIRASLFGSSLTPQYAAAYLAGGEIHGLCRKAGSATADPRDFGSRLACPECLSQGREQPLVRSEQGYDCEACRTRHPIHNGVAYLFPVAKLRELYPEIATAR